MSVSVCFADICLYWRNICKWCCCCFAFFCCFFSIRRVATTCTCLSKIQLFFSLLFLIAYSILCWQKSKLIQEKISKWCTEILCAREVRAIAQRCENHNEKNEKKNIFVCLSNSTQFTKRSTKQIETENEISESQNISAYVHEYSLILSQVCTHKRYEISSFFKLSPKQTRYQVDFYFNRNKFTFFFLLFLSIDTIFFFDYYFYVISTWFRS